MYMKDGRKYFHNAKISKSTWRVPEEVAAARLAALADSADALSTLVLPPACRSATIFRVESDLLSEEFSVLQMLSPLEWPVWRPRASLPTFVASWLWKLPVPSASLFCNGAVAWIPLGDKAIVTAQAAACVCV